METYPNPLFALGYSWWHDGADDEPLSLAGTCELPGKRGPKGEDWGAGDVVDLEGGPVRGLQVVCEPVSEVLGQGLEVGLKLRSVSDVVSGEDMGKAYRFGFALV